MEIQWSPENGWKSVLIKHEPIEGKSPHDTIEELDQLYDESRFSIRMVYN